MLGVNKTRTLVAVTLTLIIILSSLAVLKVESTNAQSTYSAAKKLTEVTNAHLTISHIWGNRLVMQLEKGDHVEGKYVVSNIFYYPNWPTIDLTATVAIRDSNNTTIYDKYTKYGGSFNFTASQSGNYTFVAFSNLVHELLWGGYILTTSQINQAIPLEVTLNYTITGAPLEINLFSPINQPYLQSNVSLEFSSSRVCDWAGYCLDGTDVVSILGSNCSVSGLGSLVDTINASASYSNTTLTNLSNGKHTITLYANDTYGNMASQTVAFTVGTSAVQPYPSTFLMIVIVTIAVTVLAVAVFYRRHRGRNPT